MDMTEKVPLPEWRRGKAGELDDEFEYRFLDVPLEPTVGFFGHPATEEMVEKTKHIHSPATRMRRQKEWMKTLVDEMEEAEGSGSGSEQRVEAMEEEGEMDEEEDEEEM